MFAHPHDLVDGVILALDFGACPNVVPQVELTVTAPKEGNKPSYSISCGSDAYYAVGGSSNYTEYRQWYESDTGYDNWREMSPGETFTSGKYYKLYVDIRTSEGYEFPLIDMGTIQPDVHAYINGYAANVYKGYEQDPSRYITVEYNFGECNDSVVESITITNIDAPVAGQTPDYLANCFGTGYSMAGTNAGNWKVNGIVWLRDGDNYTGSIMDKTEEFLAGHEYTVLIDLVADDGYTFLFNHNNGIYAAASLNGNTAQINLENCSTGTYQIWYTFTCEQKEITTIMLYDLDLPVGGNVPDTAVTPAYPEYYVVESVQWFDIEDNPVGATFETGVPYYALITVASAKTSGADVAKFADIENLTVYLDGNVLDAAAVEDNKVTIPVIIRKPSSAPEMTIYAFITQPSGGTVNAGESLNVAWQTSFIPTSTEIQYWDGEAWDQWDIQYPQNALDDYDFESHEAASYRFRIVAYIGSDVVATSNEFAIAWEEAVAAEYIYVYTPGEGNGSNDFDYVADGTQITLYTPEYMGYSPIDGFTFDYWSIRKGTAQSAEVAQKQPGEQITVDDNTYIIAIWKEAPLSEYIYVYTPGEGNGSNDFDYVTFGTQITLYTPEFMGFVPIEGFVFDYWSVRVGSALAEESARKQPGDTMIINDNTYIVAMWKYIPHECVGLPESGQGATCTVDGWKDYYRCECGNYFEDANCQTPIADLEAWKAGAGKIAASHDYGALVPAVAEKHTQTELVAGVAAYYHCSVCDTYFTEGKVETTLEALTGAIPSHSYGDWKTDGANHWKECVCGDQKDSVAHSGGTATCEAKAKCAVCSAEYGDLAAHQYSEATCTAKAKCSVCGDETGELAPHTYVDGKCACGATDPNYTPDTSEPDTEEPGTNEPDTNEPDTNEPDTSEPDTNEPDTSEPNTEGLGTSEPETNVPGTDQPEDPKENGCRSTIVGASAGFIVMTILSSAGIMLKKKDEE